MTAMKLMSCLVDVALHLSVSLDNTQRQYENERGKEASKRASERIATLVERREEVGCLICFKIQNECYKQLFKVIKVFFLMCSDFCVDLVPSTYFQCKFLISTEPFIK